MSNLHHRSRPLVASLQTETDLRKQIRDALKRHPAIKDIAIKNATRRNAQRGAHTNGEPDLQGELVGGVKCGFEVKKPEDGKISMAQWDYYRDHTRNGELVAFVRSPQEAFDEIAYFLRHK